MTAWKSGGQECFVPVAFNRPVFQSITFWLGLYRHGLLIFFPKIQRRRELGIDHRGTDVNRPGV